ncbi:MAG: hypothetical protein BWK79_13760 [Beggiatoa sp. IS2]|nr:MAG: hypothetical protein BWK79_13760 [Beggiatoa sp. IS2]
MLIKIVIVLLLLSIIASLAVGFSGLVKNEPGSHKMAKALTMRVSLSIFLFILVMIAAYFGLITPHGV